MRYFPGTKRSAQRPVLFALFLLCSHLLPAQPPPGPRTAEGKPVHLVPVPQNASPAQIQALIGHTRNVYFKPGVYNIGTLQITNLNGGVIWGAGRLTTTLRGKIVFKGCRKVTFGNFNVSDNTATEGEAAINVQDKRSSEIVFLNLLVSTNKNGTGLRLQSPGEYRIQGCNFTGNDIGVSVEDPQARAFVFGGNLQSNRIHIQQVQGHLEGRAFAMQVCKGEADVVIQSPSPMGYHLLEGIRSEGNNGSGPVEALVKVPPTTAAVHLALRANGLGSMAHYADYHAAGTLLMVENANYPGKEDKRSVGVSVHSPGPSRVISIGNKYGLSYDSAAGPFDVGPNTSVQSIGDLWMLPNESDYSKHFDEPITADAMKLAGKKVPAAIAFLRPGDSAVMQVPAFPAYQVASCPRIANLGELMLNVRDFGAIPDDGRDDGAAIQRALDSVEKGGVYQPLYFPAGRYEVSEPIFLDHLAGGGFWGDGAEKSVLASSSGKGVVSSDGAGYSCFVDMGFENKAGAESRTVELDWINNQSANKKRGNTGAALQSNMFYRDRFENGGTGLGVGRHRMGDGFLIGDCVFKNTGTAKKDGAAYVSDGFNALTNPLVHCLFENVDCAVLNRAGSFNFYGNRLRNIHSAGIRLNIVVADGFAVINNVMDSSAVPFVTTGHSSAKAHVLLEETSAQAPATTAPGTGYRLGGSLMLLDCSFPNRTIASGGGIGDNTLIVYQTRAAAVTANGRAHRYLLRPKQP